MKKNVTKLALIATAALSMTGCAAIDNMSKKERAAWGAAGGAVLGGVIGHQIDHDKGAAIGAVVGGVAGGSIGYYMDSAQEKLEKDLAKSGITITRMDKATIKLNMPSGLLFGVNQSTISGQAVASLNKVGETLKKYNQTAIMVEGHADAQGADDYNLQLSQRRSDAVARTFLGQGVAPERILSRGHGERYPIASNDSESGRAQNRRVEVFLRAVEKGNEQNAFTSVYR